MPWLAGLLAWALYQAEDFVPGAGLLGDMTVQKYPAMLTAQPSQPRYKSRRARTHTHTHAVFINGKREADTSVPHCTVGDVNPLLPVFGFW